MEAALKTEQTQKDNETAPEIDKVEFLGLGRGVRFDVGKKDDEDKPFKEGGPARSQGDLESIGLDFSKCYDTKTADQLRREGDKLQKLVDVGLNYRKVWSRDVKVPKPAEHPMTEVRINTGTNTPLRQKVALPDCHQVHTRSESGSGKAPGKGGDH
eukprot:6213239-Pleurochrysis_carterae.AAC.1